MLYYIVHYIAHLSSFFWFFFKLFYFIYFKKKIVLEKDYLLLNLILYKNILIIIKFKKSYK